VTFPSFLRRKHVEETEAPESESETNGSAGKRRDLFKMLGAGVAGAVGASLLETDPASAYDGDNLVLGVTGGWNSDEPNNSAFTNTTLMLFYNGDGYTYPCFTVISANSSGASIEATDDGGAGQTNGHGAPGFYGTGPGLWAHLDNTNNASAAVYATTAGTGIGVRALASNTDSSSPAILGQQSGSGHAVEGQANSGDGVHGESSYGSGVYGQSTGGNGVWGYTSDNGKSGVYGVDGSSEGGYGVCGQSIYGSGVYGQSTVGNGVWGHTSENGKSGVYGVDGSSGGGYGVCGQSNAGIGVLGESSGANGVKGTTTANDWGGVIGEDQSSGGGFGVQAYSNAGTGVQAASTSGYGVEAQGGKAQLYLVPGSTAGHPTSGSHNMGELYMGNTGNLWLCTQSGSPGTWKKLH